jgi:hypothetical protein
MPTVIVNCNKERYDIYIGRVSSSNLHYGNPFTGPGALDNYELWLRGYVLHKTVEPDRRKWILNTLSNLKGKRLGSPPMQHHGSVLIKLINEMPEESFDTYAGFKEIK